jgi:hypothetical protein
LHKKEVLNGCVCLPTIGSGAECASAHVRMHLLNWSALVLVLLVFGLVCNNFFVSRCVSSELSYVLPLGDDV